MNRSDLVMGGHGKLPQNAMLADPEGKKRSKLDRFRCKGRQEEEDSRQRERYTKETYSVSTVKQEKACN